MSERTMIPAVASESAKKLASILADVGLNDTVQYEKLSKAIGKDVQIEARGALTTARRIARREHGAVFEAVHNYGLKRLDPVGVSRHLNVRARRAASQARMGLHAAQTITPEQLPPEERPMFVARESLLMIAARIGMQRVQAKFAQLAEGPKPPSLVESLEKLKKASSET